MRKWLLCVGLLIAVAAPAWAAPYTIQLVPNAGPANHPSRPEVDRGIIIAGSDSVGMLTVNGSPPPTFVQDTQKGGIKYNVMTNVLISNYLATATGWSDTGQPTPAGSKVQIVPDGYWHEGQVDSSWTYDTLGGSYTAKSLVWGGLRIMNKANGNIIEIPATDSDEHLASLNDYGDVIWARWHTEDLMYSHLTGDTYSAPVSFLNGPNTGALQGARMRMATHARVAAFGNGANSGMSLISFPSLAITPIFTQATDLDGTGRSVKNFFSGIEDKGNWLVSNMRPVTANQPGEVAQSSDIWLFDINGAVTHTAMFGNYQAVREDPRIEQLDADTALIVWDEGLNGANADFYIRGAYVTGLATNTPVFGAAFDITDPVSGQSRRWPDVDHDMYGRPVVAWLRINGSGGATAGAQIEYIIIPEPATLALLGLGVLALARRR